MPHPGKQIARLRKQFSKTQEELAKSAGMSRAYLARIETEMQMPTVEMLEAIAQALHVPAGVLLMGDINNTTPALSTLHSIIEKLIDATVAKYRNA